MKELQQLIDKWKLRVEYGLRDQSRLARDKSYVLAALFGEQAKAISTCITEVELLLLNKPTGAITEAAHSANTMLSEVPTSESDTHIGGVGADSSEAEIVKQNEQTKELCPYCKSPYQFKLDYTYKCSSCDKYW